MKFAKMQLFWKAIYPIVDKNFKNWLKCEKKKKSILRITVSRYLETKHVFLLLWQREHVKYSTPITWSSATKIDGELQAQYEGAVFLSLQFSTRILTYFCVSPYSFDPHSK